MKKTAYNWIWKWHFLGGLVVFPIVLLLAVTGIIYLFKDQYEKPRHAEFKQVEISGNKISYQDQWQKANRSWDKKINAMIIPVADDQATEFTAGRFSGKSSLFINPYTGKVTKTMATKDTDMFKVRKLHGELLLGSFGTKLIELVGSWLIVLILTGLVIFFPRDRKDWTRLFRVRLKAPKQVLFRDLHMVAGFWFSGVLLIILAGGMPWTDVWGDGFKWVQKQTGTGYPPTWQGRELKSAVSSEPVSLDHIVDYAQNLDLPGELTITIPASSDGVFSIHNIYHKDQSEQVAIHLDQYSGQEIARLTWSDVGILMRARMWAMAFHQGQFGLWNWLLVLLTAFGLILLSSSAIISFFFRKKPGTFGIPRAQSYHVGAGLFVLVGVMSVLLPLFGMSVLVIFLVDRLISFRKRSIERRRVLTA